MRKSQYSEEQIIGILREAQGDTSVKALCAVLLSSLCMLACGCNNLRTISAFGFPYLPPTVKVQKNIEYAKVDGRSLRLDIYSPRKVQGKLPVVVSIHGGGWDSFSKYFCPIGHMATQNLAVVSINYRLSGAAIFPAQIHDCKGAIRWLRANSEKYNLDGDHIGIFGVSSGGHLALLLGTTADNHEMEGNTGGNLGFSSRVQCVCTLYAPTELNQLVSDPKFEAAHNGRVAQLLGGDVAQNKNRALAASPITYMNNNCPPVFLIHGAKDTLVSPEQSKIFYDSALKAGAEAKLKIVPSEDHGFYPSPPLEEEIYKFFNWHLKVAN